MASSPSSEGKLITLKSFDNAEFKIEVSSVTESGPIMDLIQSGFAADGVVPLPNLSSEILAMIVDYFKFRAEYKIAESKMNKKQKASKYPKFVESAEKIRKCLEVCTIEGLRGRSEHHPDCKLGEERRLKAMFKAWDAEFFKVDIDTLFELLNAAHYLQLKELTDLTGKAWGARMIECKGPDELRRRFNMKNDHTPEEEENIREHFSWAYNRD